MTRICRNTSALAALAILLGASSLAFAADTLAIKDAKIHLGNGEVIEKGSVVCRDGKIVAIGEDIDIPVDARVLSGDGRVVMPGIVEVHSAEAMSQANEQNDNVPFLSVVDSIDPIKSYFEDSRRNGVTTVAVMPGNSTMIGGRGAVIKTAGGYVEDMIVQRDIGMKFSLSPQSGSSRLSHFAKLREQLRQAKVWLEKQNENGDESPDEDAEKDDAKTNGSSNDGEGSSNGSSSQGQSSSSTSSSSQQRERVYKSLADVLQKKMLAYFYCDQPMDVARALRLVEEFQLKPVLVLGRDCDKAAELLARAEAPVVLSPTLVFWRENPQTREEERIVTPRILKKAGVAFLFGVDGSTSRVTYGGHYHWYQAATAVKYGMDREAALKALTLDAAKAIGVDRWVGSLEVGKDADLVVLSDDPLNAMSWVDTTVINGQVAYERSKDVKLKRLLEPSEDDQ